MTISSVMLPQTERTHRDLHSEQGALPGEHTGRSRNPVIKAADIVTESVLRLFGLGAAEAHAVCQRPLPDGVLQA